MAVLSIVFLPKGIPASIEIQEKQWHSPCDQLYLRVKPFRQLPW